MSTTEQPMGVPTYDDGRWGVRYVRRLAHPPAKVWRALTESEHLVHWMPTDIVGERRAGAPIELPFWPEALEKYPVDVAVMTGEIRVWDPPRVFEWTWDTDLLRWELEPDGDHTVLTFSTWFGLDDPAIIRDASAGYHVCLDSLRTLLDTDAVGPTDDAEMARWQARYGEAVDSIVAAAVAPAG